MYFVESVRKEGDTENLHNAILILLEAILLRVMRKLSR